MVGIDQPLSDVGAALVAAFDHVPAVYVFVKDEQRRFVTCSLPLAQLLGFSDPAELAGRRDEDVSPDHLADHYRSHDEHVLRTGQSLIDLVELVRNADGSCDWFLTTRTPVHSAAGRPSGLVGVTRELTRRDAVPTRLLSLTPAVELISRRYAGPITIADMAATVSMSTSYFTRLFRKHFGSSPYQYLRQIRIVAACDLLSTTDLGIAAIAARTGFYDQSHLGHDFRREKGVTPAGYRRSHRRTGRPRTARFSLPRPERAETPLPADGRDVSSP